MADGFETMGNATILVVQDGKPAIATDPWLAGTCYFGSWALDHPLTEKQIADVRACEWLWFSHGHPDHLHEPSLDLLPQGQKVLLADHLRTSCAARDSRCRSWRIAPGTTFGRGCG